MATKIQSAQDHRALQTEIDGLNPGVKDTTLSFSRYKSLGFKCETESPRVVAKEVFPWTLWTRKLLEFVKKEREFWKEKLMC